MRKYSYEPSHYETKAITIRNQHYIANRDGAISGDSNKLTILERR